MKWSVIVIISLVIGGISLSGAGWLSQSPGYATSDSRLWPREAETPDIRVRNMHLMEQTETATAWEVSAEEAIFSDTAHRVVMKQVQAQLLLSVAGPLRMTAERGQIDGATGDIVVQGHVRLQPREGYTIETEVLHWRAVDRTLHTDAPVRMHNPAVYIAGTGLHSNVDQHRITLQHGVQASFQLQENP